MTAKQQRTTRNNQNTTFFFFLDKMFFCLMQAMKNRNHALINLETYHFALSNFVFQSGRFCFAKFFLER